MHSKLIAAREELRHAQNSLNEAVSSIIPSTIHRDAALSALRRVNAAMALTDGLKGNTFGAEATDGREGIPADLVALVVAAREVAYGDWSSARIAALDVAVEAFAGRVPWENDPDSPEPFAKLFVVDGRQVLYIRADDDDADEDDREVLHQIVDFDGVRVDARLSNLTKSVADVTFDTMSQDTARRLVDYATTLVAGVKVGDE